MAHLLDWFHELGQGRSGNGSGPNPLAWSDIAAWAETTGVMLQAWECSVLRALDAELLRFFARRDDTQAPETLPKFSRNARRKMTEGKKRQ